MTLAIYPGSFDPITMGHIDVIKRALKMFDKVIVAVGNSKDKKYTFSMEERMEMVKESVKDLDVEVDSFSGLLVDYAKSKEATVIIRGLRAVSDFEYEFQSTLMNRKLNEDVETVFIMTRGMYVYLSSSIVKEVASLNGDLNGMVPSNVERKLRDRFK